METQLTIFEKPKSDKSLASIRLRPETEAFLKQFPNRSKVIAFFTPGRWSYCVENLEKCLQAPGVKLSQLAELYQDKELAKELIASQITGLYASTTGSYQINDAVVRQTAEMFVAHYGRQCSVYDMMLYFAHYTVEFKGVSYQFDVQDILRQFKTKYWEWKRSLDFEEPQKPMPEPQNQIRGHAALIDLCVERLREGQTADDLRACGLYKYGALTESEIKKAQDILSTTF